MHSSGFFRIKPIARLILKREILGSHTISDQSLLLSTIILNDSYVYTIATYIRNLLQEIKDRQPKNTSTFV